MGTRGSKLASLTVVQPMVDTVGYNPLKFRCFVHVREDALRASSDWAEVTQSSVKDGDGGLQSFWYMRVLLITCNMDR